VTVAAQSRAASPSWGGRLTFRPSDNLSFYVELLLCRPGAPGILAAFYRQMTQGDLS